MRRLLVSLAILISISAFGQGLEGAWEWNGTTPNGEKIKAVSMIVGDFFTVAYYNTETDAFMNTFGGSYSYNGTTMSQKLEWNTGDPSQVGITQVATITINGDKANVMETGDTWTRLDMNDSPLAGSWIITGRKNGDEIRQRDTSGPRKTMKILSGTRFQWIAYNIETREFSGTGGGTYTAKDGVYTENIEFFSRDKSRVGASLEFQFEVKDGDWHHSGNSSKGTPIYEIWSIREK